MAMQDVLRGPTKEEIITQLKSLNAKELKEVFNDAFDRLDLPGLQMIISYTSIREDKGFIASISVKRDKMKGIVALLE